MPISAEMFGGEKVEIARRSAIQKNIRIDKDFEERDRITVEMNTALIVVRPNNMYTP